MSLNYDEVFYTCRDDGKPAVEVELEDNGLGADQVAGDGLYAKYFIDFASSPVLLQCTSLILDTSITGPQEVWLEM